MAHKIYGQSVQVISGGAELNIAYGDTPPEDTSKLWCKTDEPETVEISPTLVKDIEVSTLSSYGQISNGFEHNGYFYYPNNYNLYRVNLQTRASEQVPLARTQHIDTICYYDGCVYYFQVDSGGTGYKLYRANINTLVEEELTGAVLTYTAGAVMFAANNKIYIIGGYSYSRSSGSATTWSRQSSYSTIRIYDINTKVFDQTSTFLKESVYYASYSLVGSKAYIFGGANTYYYNLHSNPTSQYTYRYSVQILDLQTNTVTIQNDVFKSALAGGWATSIDTDAYIFKDKKIYKYSTIDGILTELDSTLPASVSYVVGTQYDGYIIIFANSSNAIKVIINVTLPANVLHINVTLWQNQFNLLENNNNIKIGVLSVYKGNSSGYAQLVDAYVYDAMKFGWVNVNTGEVILDDVYQSGTVLTIENAIATQSGTEVTIE